VTGKTFDALPTAFFKKWTNCLFFTPRKTVWKIFQKSLLAAVKLITGIWPDAGFG